MFGSLDMNIRKYTGNRILEAGSENLDVMLLDHPTLTQLCFRASLALRNNHVYLWLRLIGARLLGRRLSLLRLPCEARCSKMGRFGTLSPRYSRGSAILYRWLESTFAPCDQCLFGRGEDMVEAKLAFALCRSSAALRKDIR